MGPPLDNPGSATGRVVWCVRLYYSRHMAHSCMNLEPAYILTPPMLPFSMLQSTSSILKARPSYTMYMWCGMLKSPCSLDSLSRASWTLNYPHNQSIFEVGAKSRFHGNSQKAPEYTFLLLDCSKSSCRWAIRHSLHDGGETLQTLQNTPKIHQSKGEIQYLSLISFLKLEK